MSCNARCDHDAEATSAAFTGKRRDGAALQTAPATALNHLAAFRGLGTVTSVASGRNRIYSISSTEFMANLQKKKLDENRT
jgi:hypothetical protein